jgi:hypothetical protein
MKKIFLLTVILNSIASFSQARLDYYLELKSGYELGNIQTTNNPDQTISVVTNRIDLSGLVNSRPVYSLEKAFPTAVTPRLQRVYILQVSDTTQVTGFASWEGTEKFLLIDNTSVLLDQAGFSAIPPLLSLPNDYNDPYLGGYNYDLELIKAPLAWAITPGGDPSVIVGISDSKFLDSHYDLNGQIINHLQLSPYTVSHGTGVAGVIAANTNNGMGISSLAYNTKLSTTSSSPFQSNQFVNGLLQLSQQPGVRVINCSWVICETSSTKSYLDDVMAEVTANGVLVVGGAGNGLHGNHCGSDGNGYAYPASYDQAISVTSVGSRYPIGYENTIFWWYSWKDCHYGRPNLA